MIDQFAFIDFENVSNIDTKKINAKTKVYLFAGRHQTKAAIEYASILADNCACIEIVKVKEPGPNALDFHIAYFIGKLVNQNENVKLTIFSNDKGYDPLIKYLNEEGIKVDRREIQKTEIKSEKVKTIKSADKIENKNSEKSKDNTQRKKLRESSYENAYKHFIDMPRKNRPKKPESLKAFLKTALGNKVDDTEVNEIYMKFIENGIIIIEENKMRYLV